MLKVLDVSFSFGENFLFKDLNFSLAQGELAFLLGKSGMGKSTLMKMIYFDLLPSSGSIKFLEHSSTNFKRKDIAKLRRKIGIVFQDFKLLKNRNVYQNLSFVLEVTGSKKKDIPEIVHRTLKEVGLMHRIESMPSELSGGEQQRVAIARAIVNEPVLVIADEPTGNLDPETSEEILDLFKKINSRGTAVLIATHNYALLEKYNSTKVILENKRINEFKKP